MTKVTEDLALKAEWISNDAKIITVEFNTDGGNEIDNILIENGNNILLPIDPIRDGYIFVGWLGENGNVITEDSIVDKNITIKATWKETYTWPSDCTPIGDGSKCTKTYTKDLVVYKGCPAGTETT